MYGYNTILERTSNDDDNRKETEEKNLESGNSKYGAYQGYYTRMLQERRIKGIDFYENFDHSKNLKTKAGWINKRSENWADQQKHFGWTIEGKDPKKVERENGVRKVLDKDGNEVVQVLDDDE